MELDCAFANGNILHLHDIIIATSLCPHLLFHFQIFLLEYLLAKHYVVLEECQQVRDQEVLPPI
jgi:hypothetical protein